MMLWRFMFCWLTTTCALCLNSNSYTQNHISLHFCEGLAVLRTFCGKLSQHYLNSTWEKASIHSFFLGAIIRCLYGCCKQSLHVYVCHAHSLQTPSPDSSFFFFFRLLNVSMDEHLEQHGRSLPCCLVVMIKIHFVHLNSRIFFSLTPSLFLILWRWYTYFWGDELHIITIAEIFHKSIFGNFQIFVASAKKSLQHWLALSIFS